MIIALYDLYHYRRRSGRYRRSVGAGDLMGMAFEERLPEALVSGLRPGDMLYSLTFDNFLSWLILYSTKGYVNHAAMYIGDGMIMHSTTNAGVVSEPIEALYGPNERILPCVPDWPDDARAKVKAVTLEMQGIPYGWRAVQWKALRLISGRAWPVFHWTLFLDVCLLLILLDLPAILIAGFPILSLLIPLYLVLVLFNWWRWQRKPLTLIEMMEYPTHSLEIYYFHLGAGLVPDFDALARDSNVTAYRFKDEESKRKFWEELSEGRKGKR